MDTPLCVAADPRRDILVPAAGVVPGGTRASALACLLGDALAEGAPAGVSPFALLRVAEGASLILEGAPARSVYVVQAGTFKIVRTGADGYEQVLDFVGRQDLLGCDGLAGGCHTRGAVALEQSWVYALPLADLHAMCHRHASFAARWQAAMAAEIVRTDDMAWIMAAVGAEKRAARFIIRHARRMAASGQSPRRLRLRMCRRDIASHLGLAHESVSRAFTMLADDGMLRVDNREIEILDREALEAFAHSTRGYPDGAPRRSARGRPAGLARARAGAAAMA